MKRLVQISMAVWAMAFPAVAQDSPVVVELFTSQGCSSCPPADEFMKELAARGDVIALSLHVDYWDYIGWKDEFADPKNAKRQRAYASTAGRRSVYTPEMIINGQSDIVGAKPMAVAMAIEDHKADEKHVALTLTRAGDQVAIAVSPLVSEPGVMDIIMLRYQAARVANIVRGENAGKTIKYINVTQDWQVVTQWDGLMPLETKVDAPGEFPLVVLVQSHNHGPIRAAAQLD